MMMHFAHRHLILHAYKHSVIERWCVLEIYVLLMADNVCCNKETKEMEVDTASSSTTEQEEKYGDAMERMLTAKLHQDL